LERQKEEIYPYSAWIEILVSLGYRHGEYKNALLDMNRKDAGDNVFRDQMYLEIRDTFNTRGQLTKGVV